jgi:hypothetical protein
MASEEQSRQDDSSFQRKSYREHDPHRDGLLAPFGRFEPPLFDCFHSSEVEILVSSRALDQDVLDSACVTYINFQQCRALEALSSRRLWIARFDLIPAQRPGDPTVTPEPCAWWQTGYACPATRPGPSSAQSGTARAAAPTASASPRHHAYIPLVKELPSPSFATFYR